MNDKDPYARQKAYKARQRERGLVQVQVEVPAECRPELLRIAQAMRDGTDTKPTAKASKERK